MLVADVEILHARGRRQASYNALLRVGVWLARTHPEVTGPEQWTVDICAEFVAAVDRLVIGEWSCSSFDYRFVPSVGKPLRPQSKIFALQVMRRFLAHAQNWEWMRLRCNPPYHLAISPGVICNIARSIRGQSTTQSG